MQRTTFDERKARVLAAHVALRRRQSRKPGRRALSLLGAAGATVVCFFLLKGAALAWQGEAVFAASDASPLRVWLTGVDPVTRLVADLLSPPQA